MGYKTKDPREVTDLQKAGHNVIGICEQKKIVKNMVNGRELEQVILVPGLVYEFDFEKEEQSTKTEEPQPSKTEAVKTVKAEPKKRGNPNWSKKKR